MKNNILFIGGAGFIGSNLIRKLLFSSSKKKWRVYVLEPDCADISRLQGLNVDIITGSLRDYAHIQSIISANNISTIVHLVSTMVPGSTYEDYKREFENVVFPTVSLMQLCSKMHVKFVYFSSGGTIYGDRHTYKPFSEVDLIEPISYYGLSKQMIENSLQFEHRTSGLEYLVLRPSNPYGYGQNLYGKQGLIAVSIGNILSNNSITIWGDGTSVRDYIYIEDLSDVFCQLLNKGVKNEVLNIGSGEGVSTNDVIGILRELVEENVKVEYVSPRKADVSSMVLDISRLKSLLPNLIFTSLKEGVNVFYRKEKNKLYEE